MYVMITGPQDLEYWCPQCRQLRLHVSYGARTLRACGNCGFGKVVYGPPGTLNRKELEKQFDRTGMLLDKDGNRSIFDDVDT